MQPVGLGPRIVAGIIDLIIMMVIIFPLSFIVGQSLGAQLGVSLIGIIYFIVMEALKGATVGKMAMGLKVVKKDGSAISWPESVIRNLLRIVDALPAFYIIGIVCIAVTPNKQRVGDMAASTLVVKK
ncbi:hypothetical protein DSM104443_00515 [Usitatibacter rugosus]|uniref:RDD domain-containing protein n=1 Tax=Usitatibacter rugosus TaxID=2732067 RepID=A0A6M4GQG2_9PROT|nr:RDD family protein [Usitatibacter rugosus]QJR09471.1 hypothetical protein DSM104443_00515 [Usitatibacter rugosus]